MSSDKEQPVTPPPTHVYESDEGIVCHLYETHLEIFIPYPRERCNKRMATLAAANIPFECDRQEAGFVLKVPIESARQALLELQLYDKINADWPPPGLQQPFETDHYNNLTGTFYLPSILLPYTLLMWYAKTGPVHHVTNAFTKHGTAIATAIRQGELHRIVTALTLHADGTHVLSNALWIGIFSTGMAIEVGWGSALLILLLCGAGGNLLAAWLADLPHNAVGASTAVFGLCGCLAAIQAIVNYRRYRCLKSIWHRSWVVLGAGLLFLGMLGTSQQADFEGHFWGFSTGVLLAPCALAFRGLRTSLALQWIFTVFTVFIFVASWLISLY